MKAVLLLPNQASGQHEVFEMDLTQLNPGNLPKPRVGVFRYVFSFDTGDGPEDFEATVTMNDSEIHAAFTEFPVISSIYDNYDIMGPQRKICEMKATGTKDRVLRLKASLFGKSHIWITITNGQAMGGTWDSTKKQPHVLPFYNFYNNGSMCMGSLALTGKPLEDLNRLLSAYTTPHATMSDRGCVFKPCKDMKLIVCDKAPRADPFDYPVDRRIFTDKPIATLLPP